RRARRDEADLHADVAAQDRRLEDRRSRAGAVGAVRRDRRARDRRQRRGDAGDRGDAGAAREIRRRRAERAEAQRRGLSPAGARAHAEGRGIVKKHLVLVGLPGAGKSTVGRLVAEQLQTSFVDIDSILLRKEGKPITMIFAEKGEQAFREMERKEVADALGHEPAVIVPGGGWAAQPGTLDDAKPRGYVTYLKARAELPIKAKTIGEYLGRGYTVKATVGHRRDLPKRELGVDVENGFTPKYVTIKEKAKTLAEIKKAAKAADRVLLATDPDREGEAIAWHVASQLNGDGGRIRRVLFHEITKDAVAQPLANPLDID